MLPPRGSVPPTRRNNFFDVEFALADNCLAYRISMLAWPTMGWIFWRRSASGRWPSFMVAESAIDEVAALSAQKNIQYFYNILKKAFCNY